MKRRQLRGFDLRQLGALRGLIGVDEAGRGALAGPVVAGAVLARRDFFDSHWCRRKASTVDDSKRLTPEQRASIFESLQRLMSESRILFASGVATVEEIEERNILGATKLAMRRAILSALEQAGVRPHPPDPLFEVAVNGREETGSCITDWRVLLDGVRLRDLGFEHLAFTGGDARSLVIAMASIVAKVTRDRLMESLEAESPGYGFARHKGYATAVHRSALIERGSCCHHRRVFVETFLSGGGLVEDPDQLVFSECDLDG